MDRDAGESPSAALDQTREQASVSALRVFGRIAVCTFFAVHVAATVVINLPPTTAFGEGLRAPFAGYHYLTGIWQNWAMFDTIPRYRSIHPRLLATFRDRKPRTYGAMLPGLKRYGHSSRLGSLYLRYVWQSADYATHVNAYLSRACSEIARKVGDKPKTVSLVLDSQTLLPIAEVLRTGNVAERRRDTSPIVVTCP